MRQLGKQQAPQNAEETVRDNHLTTETRLCRKGGGRKGSGETSCAFAHGKELHSRKTACTPKRMRDRLLSDVNGAKGGLRSTYEGLGKRYGVSATCIGQIVRELKKEGAVRGRSSRNGTTIVPALGLALAN